MQPLQLDLFEERTLRLARARRALGALDLSAATEELAACLSRYPGDHEATGSLAKARRLGERLAALQSEHGDTVVALLLLETEIDAATRQGWHCRLAREAERRDGGGCHVAGAPAGLHWLLGGELEEAERSLQQTLDREPGNARCRGYLGDVHHHRGETGRARREYLRALLDDPHAVDFGRLADPEVAALPSVAAIEHEVPDSPLDWVAAVGTVEGVLPLPGATLPGLGEPGHVLQICDSPGRSFYRFLLQERSASSHGERVAARSGMKRLCPSLLRSYLERFY